MPTNEHIEKCEHKWSIPVIAPYTWKPENTPTLRQGYDVFISCEKCGEIKKYR